MDSRAAQSASTRFAAVAAGYDSCARVQKSVAARLGERLSDLPEPQRVLEVGCGSGQLTVLLMRKWSHARIDAIDYAARMIEEARRRFPASDRLRPVVADACTYQGDSPYDVIVSSSSLHWVHPLSRGVNHLAGLLKQGGLFACALMLEGTLGELHASRARVVPAKPPLGGLPSAAEVRQCFRAAGLDIEDSFREKITASYVSARAFLRDIHGQGVTGGPVSRSAAPLVRGDLERLVEDYERHYRNDDSRKVVATFEVLYLKAHRAV